MQVASYKLQATRLKGEHEKTAEVVSLCVSPTE